MVARGHPTTTITTRITARTTIIGISSISHTTQALGIISGDRRRDSIQSRQWNILIVYLIQM
jgi:hypothetical protein